MLGQLNGSAGFDLIEHIHQTRLIVQGLALLPDEAHQAVERGLTNLPTVQDGEFQGIQGIQHLTAPSNGLSTTLQWALGALKGQQRIKRHHASDPGCRP